MKNPQIIAILAITLAIIPQPLTAQQPTPIAIARQFYSWNINSASSSLPSEREISPIKNLLDPNLLTSLNQAKAVESCLSKLAARLGDKPNIFKGDIFADNYEGISKVNNLKISRKNNIAIVTVSLTYRSHSWIDRLIIHQKSGRWFIVDIKYKSGKSLVKNLTSYVEQYRSTCQID